MAYYLVEHFVFKKIESLSGFRVLFGRDNLRNFDSNLNFTNEIVD